MIDVPPAIAAAGGDRRAQCVLQGVAYKCRIDAGICQRAGEIRCKDQTMARTHQRCSILLSAAHASQNAPMMASVVMKASAMRRREAVGRRPTTARGHSATTPANSRSGVGRVQLMRAR
jgi:hypothetical protein